MWIRDSGGSERSNSTRQLQQKPDLCSMGMPTNFCYYFTCGLEFLITATLMFPPLRSRLVKCQEKCKLINNRGNAQFRFVRFLLTVFHVLSQTNTRLWWEVFCKQAYWIGKVLHSLRGNSINEIKELCLQGRQLWSINEEMNKYQVNLFIAIQ